MDERTEMMKPVFKIIRVDITKRIMDEVVHRNFITYDVRRRGFEVRSDIFSGTVNRTKEEIEYRSSIEYWDKQFPHDDELEKEWENM